MADTIPNAATLTQLEDQLDSFDASVRARALAELANRVRSGDVELPPERRAVNLHYHTFFSYNANGWSPSRIAWEARKHGLAAAGIVDFDVLDGMEEFLSAGEALGLRSTAAVESRVFINEYSDRVINSPNEPGVAYFMAAGCFRQPDANSRAAEILQSMRQTARRRNVQVMERVNEHLGLAALDYEADVLPLTPSGNATERHLLAAYDAKAREVLPNTADLAEFWADKLGVSTAESATLLNDTPKLHETIRSKLMKFGGVGYVPPTPETFPSVETMIEMTLGLEALPTATWLDGTNPGESDMPSMLDLLARKGVAAMNIIPDRNWNIKDPAEKQVKLENLRKAVEAARETGFPLSVGTEMNKAGLPFVDDFSAPELAPYVDDFIDGAHFFWGHTLLARALGIGFASDWANTRFGADRIARNRFYTRVGRSADPVRGRAKLEGLNVSAMTPEDVLAALQ